MSDPQQPPQRGAGQEPTVLADVAPAQATLRLAPGMVLAGRFEIQRRLGEGGAGAVYAARDRLLGEPVALKLLHGRAAGAELTVLRSEVRAARRIAHANVCRVHDLCEHAGLVFLVMELVPGETLRKRLRHGLGLAGALDAMRQLGAALSAAHRVGVVHCDVKPENAMYAGERLVLTDFGIARRRGEAAGARTGEDRESTGIEGTPAYMAPEQVLGRAVDERTDVFALAAVTYELLCGRPPLTGNPLSVLLEQILHTDPVWPAEVPAGLPPATRAALAAAVLRGLAKDPAERYESTEALVAAVTAAVGSSTTNEPAAGAATAGAATTSTPSSSAAAPVVAEGSSRRQDLRRVSPVPLPPGGRTRGTRRLATVLHLIVATEPGADAERDGDDTEELAERGEALLAAGDAALADAGAAIVGRTPHSIVAVFGATLSRGDEPLRAGETARALVAAAPPGVLVRVAVESGRLLVREELAGPTVSGDPLARAAALAAAAAPGEVLVGARAARHVARRYTLRPSVSAPGAQVVLARRPLGERDLDSPPLVGRDDELARLVDEVLAPARGARAGAALVLAGAGLGKTRLLTEILDVVQARGGVTVVGATGEPGQTLAAGGVLCQLLRRLARLPEDAGAEAARAAADTLFAGVGVGGLAMPGLVDALAAMLAGEPGGSAATPGASTTALTAARAAFAAAARSGPLLVVVDDAHWADDRSLELVEALARGDAGTPLALLVLARPELGELRAQLRALFPLVVELRPLPAAAAVELALRSLGAGADAAAAQQLAAAAEGNPFFIEELARDARERRGAAEAGPPATIEEVIQTRLDRLDADERELVRAAAVLGASFRRAALAPLAAVLDLGSEGRVLDPLLAALEARHILVAHPADADVDDRYGFRHALVRDAAYRELTPAARRALHAAAATDLAGRLGGDHDTTSEPNARPPQVAAGGESGASTGELIDLARHLEGADRAGEAAEALRRAGALAARQLARADALRCYERARILLGDAAGADLLVDLAEAALEAGAFTEAERALTDAAAPLLVAPLLARARALGLRAQLAQQRARWDEALSAARAGLALLDPDADAATRALAARLHGQLGWVLGYILGDNARGLPESQRAVDLLADADRPVDLAYAYSRLGANFMRAGRFRDQLRCNRETLRLAEQAGALEQVARAHVNLGVNLDVLGELDEALASTRRALALYERMGARPSLALAQNNLALVLCDLGRDAEAEAALAIALRLVERQGGAYFQNEAECTRARIAVRAGDLTGALATLAAVVVRARAEGSRSDEAVALRLQAAVLSRLGRHAEALAALDAAEALASVADLGEAARVRAERTRCLARAGQPAEAAAAAAAELGALGLALDLAKLRDLAWI